MIFRSLLIGLLTTGVAAAPSVAVMNFTNNTGSNGLNYLSSALPESVSGALAARKDIRIVERNNLKAVLNELALDQSGVVETGGIDRIGRIAQAEFLILGSYTGNAGELQVTLKAVDVASSRVIDGRNVSGNLGEVFDLTNAAAVAMVGLITGEDAGIISIDSVPSGANVYIDGNLTGKTPITELRVAAGERRIKLTKSGYASDESSIRIRKGERSSIRPVLASDAALNRPWLGIALGAYQPTMTYASTGGFGSLLLGQNFGMYSVAGELAFSNTEHNETIPSVFGSIRQERTYRTYSAVAHTAIHADRTKKLAPYAGAFFGFTNFTDTYQVNGEEETLREGRAFFLGPKVGIDFLPAGNVTIFLEGRYLWYPSTIVRDRFESQGILGGLRKEEESVRLDAWAIIGGVRIAVGG